MIIESKLNDFSFLSRISTPNSKDVDFSVVVHVDNNDCTHDSHLWLVGHCTTPEVYRVHERKIMWVPGTILRVKHLSGSIRCYEEEAVLWDKVFSRIDYRCTRVETTHRRNPRLLYLNDSNTEPIVCFVDHVTSLTSLFGDEQLILYHWVKALNTRLKTELMSESLYSIDELMAHIWMTT
ncbi:hypothetical protein J6590_056705 [Homalodisca vitripennis]|nr:hypothetical protein J6590_056705 [Homalodisca vitripennis]